MIRFKKNEFSEGKSDWSVLLQKEISDQEAELNNIRDRASFV